MRYAAFTDPSGGRGDSFTLAIAHNARNTSVLDCLYERRAPFNPSVVVSEIATLLRSYGVGEVTGDRYAANWVTEGFANEGITYRQAERDRSAVYLDALPLFTAGRARLLDNDRLAHQLVSLERRTSRNGRDRVDHPPGGADDLANAAAGALVLAASEATPTLWRHANLLASDGSPVPWPRLVDLVFASVAADERGLAILYWAHNWHFDGPMLTLIDYDRQPFTPDLFAVIRDRLHTEARAAHARVQLFTTAALAALIRTALDEEVIHLMNAGQLALARVADLPVKGVSDALLVDREALMLAAAAQIGSGKVQIAKPAQERSLHLPLPLFDLHPGAPPSAATDAALIGIGVTVDLQALPRASTAGAPLKRGGLAAAR